MTKTTILVLGLVCFASLLCGCGTSKGYAGPGKSSAEVAVVRAHGVDFKSVNGIEVGAGSSGLELLPGENEIELTINASNYNDPGAPRRVLKLKMKAEAGREYAVTGARGHGQLCAFPLNAAGMPNFSMPTGCVEP